MTHDHPQLAPGLYAITPADWPPARLLAAVAEALAGGVRLVQYRAKPAADLDLARELASICHAAGGGLIINDDVELAAASGADGVHLGRDDAHPEAARQRLGSKAIIGASGYNDLERAARLARSGVDYLAFGSLFASPTKPHAVHCAPDILTQARKFGLPVAAIGGITVDNAAIAIAAGADLVAVISGLFEAEDIRARARQFQEQFAT